MRGALIGVGRDMLPSTMPLILTQLLIGSCLSTNSCGAETGARNLSLMVAKNTIVPVAGVVVGGPAARPPVRIPAKWRGMGGVSAVIADETLNLMIVPSCGA